MFTGIVEEVGKVLDVQKTNTAAHFKIEAPADYDGCETGRQHCSKRDLPYRDLFFGDLFYRGCDA